MENIGGKGGGKGVCVYVCNQFLYLANTPNPLPPVAAAAAAAAMLLLAENKLLCCFAFLCFCTESSISCIPVGSITTWHPSHFALLANSEHNWLISTSCVRIERERVRQSVKGDSEAIFKSGQKKEEPISQKANRHGVKGHQTTQRILSSDTNLEFRIMADRPPCTHHLHIFITLLSLW